MSISKSLFDLTRLVPQTDETDWGDEVTSYEGDLLDIGDGYFFKTGANIGYRFKSSQTLVLAAAATISPNGIPVAKIGGSGGAVTLSATTAIADGTKDLQILILIGQSDTNTVTINDGANTSFNGPIVFDSKTVMQLIWDATLSAWREISRNN